MYRKRILLTALLTAFVLPISAMAPRLSGTAQGAPAQKTTSATATATFHDYDAPGTTLLLLRSDDYNGTGQATYASSTGHK